MQNWHPERFVPQKAQSSMACRVSLPQARFASVNDVPFLLIELTAAAGVFFPLDSCPGIASSSEWEASYGVITGGTQISTLQVSRDICGECVSACLASVDADGVSNCYAIRYSRKLLYDPSRQSFFNLSTSGTDDSINVPSNSLVLQGLVLQVRALFTQNGNPTLPPLIGDRSL